MRSSARHLAVLHAAAWLAVASGCSRQDDWYDESKRNDMARKERVDTLMMQGMAETQARRFVEIEASERATEHQAPPPVEGRELQDAMQRPPDEGR